MAKHPNSQNYFSFTMQKQGQKLVMYHANPATD